MTKITLLETLQKLSPTQSLLFTRLGQSWCRGLMKWKLLSVVSSLDKKLVCLPLITHCFFFPFLSSDPLLHACRQCNCIHSLWRWKSIRKITNLLSCSWKWLVWWKEDYLSWRGWENAVSFNESSNLSQRICPFWFQKIFREVVGWISLVWCKKHCSLVSFWSWIVIHWIHLFKLEDQLGKKIAQGASLFIVEVIVCCHLQPKWIL